MPSDKGGLTARECVTACFDLARAAGQQEAMFRSKWEQAPVGEKATHELAYQAMRFNTEAEHWRRMAKWWRARVDQYPSLADQVSGSVAKAYYAGVARDPLPREREPGEDDE